MAQSTPLPVPALAAPKPVPAAPKPEPQEPAQSEELTHALRAFAPLPQTPVEAQPEPITPVQATEVAAETFVFEAPAPAAPIATPTTAP
ncbi:hypothetical protein O6466_24355, partial [Salmonella enterica subsp. enterica]